LKKLALSAALIHGPKLLFLDEPFEGIDAITNRTIKDILLSLQQRVHGGHLGHPLLRIVFTERALGAGHGTRHELAWECLADRDQSNARRIPASRMGGAGDASADCIQSRLYRRHSRVHRLAEQGAISGPEPRHLRTLHAEPSLVGDGGKWA